MKLTIYLPKATGFDIEIDGQSLQSEYSDITFPIQLEVGKHIISAIDQAPTPNFWSKIFRFFNPCDQTINDYSSSYELELTEDNDIQLSVKYGDYDRVDFDFNE